MEERSVKSKLREEASRIGQDAIYSAKGHFAAAEAWSKLNLILGLPAALLAAIAGGAALTRFDHHSLIAGLLAICVAALTAMVTFLNPQEKANLHARAGNAYTSLRNKSRIFGEIHCSLDTPESELLAKLEELDERRTRLNQGSPKIPPWAYRVAKQGMQEGEAEYDE
jgi:hypothetical protein